MTKYRWWILFALLVILPLALGTAVYVGWRTSIVAFDWMRALGISENSFRSTVPLPPIILYSFPDGCWVFAGTSWMLLIWRRMHAWVYSFLALGLISELGQRIGLVRGTFEWNDILFYIAGFFFACFGYRHVETRLVAARVGPDVGVVRR